MKFYTLRTAPLHSNDIVFRQSWLHHVSGALFAAGLTGGCAFHALRASSVVLWIGIVFLVLVTLAFISQMLHALHSQNWLVRCHPRGLLVKYRSFLNEKLPDQTIIVEIGPEEMQWIGAVREQVITPKKEGNRRGYAIHQELVSHLDIQLVSAGLSELKEHLNVERKLNPNCRDYPVRIIDKALIRITWRGDGGSWISPNAQKAAALISRALSIRLEPRRKIITHYTQIPEEPAAREAMVRELIERGSLAATDVAQNLFGYSLSEAHQYVDQLEEKMKS